jgi:hypothetical protein
VPEFLYKVETVIGNTVEIKIKELEPMKAYKYMSVEESHNIEHKNEK